MPDRQTPETLFLQHRERIDRAAAMICKQKGVWGAEAEDFASWVRMKVMENEYAIIRNHRGDAQLSTYLTNVVVRQFHEYWRQRKGRWRVSAAATRMGPPAPELETLVQRDGYTLEQAGQKLRTSGRTTLSDTELARLMDQLRERAPLRPVEVPAATRDTVLSTTPGAARADARVTAAEADERRARVIDVLQRAIGELAPEDRMIARMRLQDGMSVADVGRALNLEQKPLYRRVDRLRARLRQFLEREGIHGTALRDDEEDE